MGQKEPSAAGEDASGAGSPEAVPATAEPLTVTATTAQNEFGRLLDAAARDRDVVITRHNAPRAVLMSVARYQRLVGAETMLLDTLADEFDALLARMQEPDVRAATERGFRASPEAMGRAAEAAARQRPARRRV